MGLTGLPEVSSINHNPCLHELHTLSNTIIVLVFRELASFVRKILQREENKGVELTVPHGNSLREGSTESKRKKKKRQLPHACITQPARDGARRKKPETKSERLSDPPGIHNRIAYSKVKNIGDHLESSVLSDLT
jgi:hypothetical protein